MRSSDGGNSPRPGGTSSGRTPPEQGLPERMPSGRVSPERMPPRRGSAERDSTEKTVREGGCRSLLRIRGAPERTEVRSRCLSGTHPGRSVGASAEAWGRSDGRPARGIRNGHDRSGYGRKRMKCGIRNTTEGPAHMMEDIFEFVYGSVPDTTGCLPDSASERMAADPRHAGGRGHSVEAVAPSCRAGTGRAGVGRAGTGGAVSGEAGAGRAGTGGTGTGGSVVSRTVLDVGSHVDLGSRWWGISMRLFRPGPFPARFGS